ncbi:BMP family ABC transporter substrate-binding protein [Ensifer sp. ENS06]|uniref:BMP family lipoprotein n=1 Tax=Ensifer sp. ENS06 TaxID=2769276 RepID=UPI0017821CBE|nr:BMP family ABC transporter substrate-binding protein [Ensifer sp. ENS06]MBD9627084.1 BMP family ABC transporter substrate-binding protein [Ensifer sp. ENS06]
MTNIWTQLSTTAVLAIAACSLGPMAARAEDIKPAILYDLGGKFDKSFNEPAFDGARKFVDEHNLELMEFEPQTEAQREQALRTFAEQGGNPILAVGFAWQPALEKVAPEFPDAKFIIVDTTVDLPNVESIEFAYNEGSFLVGALAGLKTKTGTVGFVGGMDIPIIRDFACGYQAGVHLTKPGAKVIVNMAGTTPAAWTDPARGRELTLGQFEQGADIVHGAAGATTLGVLQAAADAKKLAIGVGTNQNDVQPGHVLTTNNAALDVAVYKAFESAQNGTWKPGSVVLGVKDRGVDWVLDDNNRPLLTDEDIAKMNEIKQSIVDGKIKVPSYLTNGTCPAE